MGARTVRRASAVFVTTWLIVLSAGYDPILGAPLNPSPSAATGQLYTIRLRFHLLRTDDSIYIDTSADEPLVKQWIERVNEVWQPARIRFEVENVMGATPRNVRGYDDYFPLLRDIKRERRAAKRGGRTPPKRGDQYRWSDMLPLGGQIPRGIDVYVSSRVAGGGGVFLCSTPAVVVSETHLRRRPHAAPLAHELGHALGLNHGTCTPEGNLMMKPCGAGRSNPVLTADQIRTARSIAATGRSRRCRRGAAEITD